MVVILTPIVLMVVGIPGYIYIYLYSLLYTYIHNTKPHSPLFLSDEKSSNSWDPVRYPSAVDDRCFGEDLS